MLRRHGTGQGAWRWLNMAAKMTVVAFALTACAEMEFLIHTAKRVNNIQDHSQGQGAYKIGKPYQIEGAWYYPSEDYTYSETGIASWYGEKFHGRDTANGESYDMNAVTAAHRTLPLPSIVRVTNLDNGRSLILRINDRGPYARGRILDASRRSAQLLGFKQQGTARVRVEIMAAESRALAARLKGETQLAAADSPITVGRLPKALVSAEALPPPPGGATAPARGTARVADGNQKAVASLPDDSQQPRANVGIVTTAAVKPTNMFIQAGAFAYFDNANQVRARLARLGSVKISPVMINGKDLFRVRVGPLTSLDEADKILETVIQTGYANARIIVD